ncbi:hypothetical protein D3C72_2189830 [compost metagenome]
MVLMPYLPHSTAMARVMCTMPALLMQYTPICGSTCKPAIEAILMMRCCFFGSPLARAIMRLAVCWATKNEPRRLVSITNE